MKSNIIAINAQVNLHYRSSLSGMHNVNIPPIRLQKSNVQIPQPTFLPLDTAHCLQISIINLIKIERTHKE